MAADRGDWQAMRNSGKKVKVESLKVKNNIYAWEHQSRCVLFKWSLKGSLLGSMPASWCHVWTPAPPVTKTPWRRIQRRAPVLALAPGSLFPAEGSCRGRPRNISIRASSQPWHQQPLVPVLWIPAPQSVLLFLYVALGPGEAVPDLSGRLTASGSEPQRNYVYCWSDRGQYTFKTFPPEPSAVEEFLHWTAISEITSPVPTLQECLAQPQYRGAVFNACCENTALLGCCAENLQCSPLLTLTAMD